MKNLVSLIKIKWEKCGKFISIFLLILGIITFFNVKIFYNYKYKEERKTWRSFVEVLQKGDMNLLKTKVIDLNDTKLFPKHYSSDKKKEIIKSLGFFLEKKSFSIQKNNDNEFDVLIHHNITLGNSRYTFKKVNGVFFFERLYAAK
jgi:hypothetical protein